MTNTIASRPRARALAGLTAALLLLAAASCAAIPAAAGAPPAAAKPVAPAPAARRAPTSLDHEPGYTPLFDSDSASVAAGRRLNAPLVNVPLRGGARSLDDLGRAVCRTLHAGNRDSLLRLCVTDAEFRDLLWPEFPQSRPATGLEWEDAWKILYARLHSGCGQALRDHGGHWYEFQRFETDSVSRYRNYSLHGGLTLVVRDDAGGVQRWRWLRAVVERKGSFKIYSTDD